MSQVLNYQLLNMNVAEWLEGLLLIISFYMTLKFFKFFLFRHTAKKGFNFIWLNKLVGRTSNFFLLFLASYIGMRFLPPYPARDSFLWYLFVIVFFCQIALWGDLFITLVIDRQLEKNIQGDSARATTLKAGGFVSKFIFYFLIIIMALENFGINITSLVAGLGIGGVAIALAIQNILGDIFASLTILLDKPFLIGDAVVIGEFTGTVENIGIKTTRIRSIWGEQIVFANNDMLKSRIQNFGRMSDRLVVFTIKIDRRTDLEKLERIPATVKQLIEAIPDTRFERTHLKDILEHSFSFEIVFRTLSPNYQLYMDTREKVNISLLKTLKKENILLAYQTQKIYLEREHS